MYRREFIKSMGCAVLASPQLVFAQPSRSLRRIGVLMSVHSNDPEGRAQFAALVRGLTDLGWSDGQNLQLELRWGGSDVNQIRAFAKELVSLQPELIVAQGTPVTAAVQRETRTIPIVFVVVTDPVGDGFVTSLARPGGNTTVFLTSEAAIAAKMFELLKEVAPEVKRVAMLFNPDTAPGGGRYYYGDFESAAKVVRVEPIQARARNDAEIENAIASLQGSVRGGLIVMPDFFMLNNVASIVKLAAFDKLTATPPTGGNGHIGIGPDNLFIHMTGMSDKAWQKVKDVGAQVSIAFPIERNMRHGMPLIVRMQKMGLEPSLSTDVECTLTADFFTQMRSCMNLQRMLVNQMILDSPNGNQNLPNPLDWGLPESAVTVPGPFPYWPTPPAGIPGPLTTRDLLRYATMSGAKALRLDTKTGSLTPGKEADIIILDATAINVAPLNQVPGAVVSLMERTNVETVIVAGKIRKWKGQLLDIDLPHLRQQLEASRDHVFNKAGVAQDLFSSQ